MAENWRILISHKFVDSAIIAAQHYLKYLKVLFFFVANENALKRELLIVRENDELSRESLFRE